MIPFSNQDIVVCRFTISSHRGRQTLRHDSHTKQRVNSDSIFFICSTRPGCKFLDDGWQVLRWPLEWPCSVTFHILPVFLLPGVAQSPPCAVCEHRPDPQSQSFFGIMETASDSHGRHGRPPLWPYSTGDRWGEAMLSNALCFSK